MINLSPTQMTLTLFIRITLFHIKYVHTIMCQAQLCGTDLNFQKLICNTWQHQKEQEEWITYSIIHWMEYLHIQMITYFLK